MKCMWTKVPTHFFYLFRWNCSALLAYEHTLPFIWHVHRSSDKSTFSTSYPILSLGQTIWCNDSERTTAPSPSYRTNRRRRTGTLLPTAQCIPTTSGARSKKQTVEKKASLGSTFEHVFTIEPLKDNAAAIDSSRLSCGYCFRTALAQILPQYPAASIRLMVLPRLLARRFAGAPDENGFFDKLRRFKWFKWSRFFPSWKWNCQLYSCELPRWSKFLIAFATRAHAPGPHP